METSSIDNIYVDYLKIKNMSSITLKIKKRMLTEFFSINTNPWRVVGITEKALAVFKLNNFKRVSRMGINRSHLVDRHKRDDKMLSTEFKNAKEWWNYYYENDKTILATSEENMSNSFSTIHPIDEELSLFRHSGFAWRHTKSESNFLENMYKSI